MSDTFNLDRHTNIANNIDPTGKKWEIFHIKGSALYTARPNPFNEQTKIPGEFEGRWTKHTLLQEQINLYLTRAWDAAEEAQRMAASRKRTQSMKEETKAKNKTAKESLDELPDEIKAELGDVIATKE